MPDTSTQLVRGHLQNASVSYKNGAYVNQEIFPVLDMPSATAKIAKYNLGDTFRNEAEVRARGAAAKVRDWKVSTVNVDTKQYAIAGKITDEDIRDAGFEGMISPPINMQQDTIEANADKIDLGREIRLSAYIRAATWQDGNAGGEDAAGLWAATDSTNTFMVDIQTAVSALKGAGVPDVQNLRLAMDWKTWAGLNRVAEIRDVLKYTSSDPLSPEKLATFLGIGKIVVASAIYNSAIETKAGTDMTGAYVWDVTGNKGWSFLYYYPSSIGLKMMAAGVQPRSRLPNGEFRASYSWYENKEHATYFETQEESGIQTIYTGAAYQWKDTHTT